MLAIHPTAEAVADAVADLIEDEVAGAEAATIGLAGGSTPAATYARLSHRRIDWSRTTFWLGDERWVPAEHPDANAAMVRQTLGAAAERLVAPEHDVEDPASSAAAYETVIRAAFAATGGRPGTVLLGMGDDGHTASLFPGTNAVHERDRDYVANWVESKGTWRLTATLPLLWSARRIVFVVTGEAKAEMVRRIVEEAAPLPAQLVAAGNANVTWFLDQAAAAQLTTSPPSS